MLQLNGFISYFVLNLYNFKFVQSSRVINISITTSLNITISTQLLNDLMKYLKIEPYSSMTKWCETVLKLSQGLLINSL